MTKNRIFERNHGAWWISIFGHAGYNPGNDIVCAAVSTLCYTLMQSLEDAKDLCDERSYQ